MGRQQPGWECLWGRAKKSQIKKKWKILCVAECLLWIVFKLNVCINPYTHKNMQETNKGWNNSDIQTPERKISSTKRTIIKIVGEPFHGRWELDSYADTNAAGKNCAIIKYTDRSCDVAPLLEKYTPMKDIPIVSTATVFMSANGRTYILVFHKELYMPDIRHTLINPNQCLHFGAKLQPNPYYEDYPMSIESPDGEFSACLHSVGTVMLLDNWFPNQDDLKSYPHIELTSLKHWNLKKNIFHKQNILCKMR